jgi:dienelactone hydrolase
MPIAAEPFGGSIPLRMRSHRTAVALLVVALAVALFNAAAPYARAASLIVRAANLGGRAEAIANAQAHRVTPQPRHKVPTRYGDVAAQFYTPDEDADRAVLLIPGIHSMGIEEPRLTALAADLAASGVSVMAMALPDLQRYRITARSSDIIEDAVAWMSARPDLAPDGRVGVIGISFAGGLSIVAAGRPSIRDKVAFVLSFGGHGDLKRVMRYLATGTAPDVPGLRTHPPHDYGVAVILYAGADRVVPPAQVAGLREGVETFLLASQLTLVSMDQANAMFAKARDMAKALPEPSSTYLTYVNDRNVKALGAVLLPHIEITTDPAASAEHAASPPAAPVFLLHGDDDTVIPAAESVLLDRYLRERGAEVHLLLSGLITHAEVDRSAAASETWKLVHFWARVLRQ